MKVFTFALFCSLGATAWAGIVDPRESHVMLDALRAAGVQTITAADGSGRMVARSVECLRTIPEKADETSACTLVDAESAAKHSLGDPKAKLLFLLTAHYGGVVEQWQDKDASYQKVTASRIDCEHESGPNHAWLCDVVGQE